jgi:peptide-methionine (R)-S-oxide reductase
MNRKPKNRLREKLNDISYQVTQEAATEPPFSGKYLKTDKKGNYVCICCGHKLFSSDTKFESGTGWPSFNEAFKGAIEAKKDTSHGMERTEVLCGKCHAHLGHVFEESSQPTSKRFCINSAALKLIGEKKWKNVKN